MGSLGTGVQEEGGVEGWGADRDGELKEGAEKEEKEKKNRSVVCEKERKGC